MSDALLILIVLAVVGALAALAYSANRNSPPPPTPRRTSVRPAPSYEMPSDTIPEPEYQDIAVAPVQMTQPQRLQWELELLRRQGYAVEVYELDNGDDVCVLASRWLGADANGDAATLYFTLNAHYPDAAPVVLASVGEGGEEAEVPSRMLADWTPSTSLSSVAQRLFGHLERGLRRGVVFDEFGQIQSG